MDTIISNQSEIKVVKKSKLENISFFILLVTIFIAPVIFISSVYVPQDMVKAITITIGVLLSAVFYAIYAFRTKSLLIPKGYVGILAYGVIASLIVSTAFGTNPLKSFFGQGFEIGTASSLLMFFLSALLVLNFTVKNKDRQLYIYGAILTSFVIIALIHIIRLFAGPAFLSFGVFQNPTSTLIGKWGDLALLSGIVSIVSYSVLRYIPLKKLYRILLWIVTIVSLLFVVIVNSPVIWFVGMVVSALLIAYEYSETKLIKKIPLAIAIVFVLMVLGLWKGDKLLTPLTNKFNLTSTEVSLPWRLTLDVSTDTIKEYPLFGAGPNRFGSEYLKHKPLIVNQTQFWNSEFSNGFALIPSFIVTQGFIGFILWLLLVIAFGYTGFKALKKNSVTGSRFLVTSSFFSALFLWIINLVYTPSHTIIFFAFVLSGLFLAAISAQDDTFLMNINNSTNALFRKLTPTFLIILVIVVTLWTIMYIRKVVAIGYFEGGISTLSVINNDNLLKAETNFKKAIALDKNDTYYQALSEVNILKSSSLAQELQSKASQSGGTLDSELVTKIGSLIEEAVEYTKQAINIDPTNYYNHLAQARISEVALSFKVPGAYENTREAYMSALKYNPFSPLIYLNLARVEVSQNKLDEAQKNIGLALQLKQDYLDAIFLLSQIQVTQGKIQDAITSVKIAAQINPNNPLIFFQLGLLQYNDSNYQGAIDSLSQALKLDNNYANAQYFLGLAYARVNKLSDAIIQFENLSKTNPDNQEVALILKNLKDGRSPFADAKAPIDSKPEKRKALPIKAK